MPDIDLKGFTKLGDSTLVNDIKENVISFIQDFPKELDLVRFVDYDTQFNKAFLEPVKAILNAIGWSDERKITLESFFG